MGHPGADPPGGLGGDQRSVQPRAAQDVQDPLGWRHVQLEPVQPEPGLGAAQPGQGVTAAGAVVHEPGQKQLHALVADRGWPRCGAGAQPVAGRVPPVPVDGVDAGEPGGAQLIEGLAPVIADMRVEEARQIRGVRPGSGCRVWPEPGMRACAAGVQGLRQAGEQLVTGAGQDGIQVRRDLPECDRPAAPGCRFPGPARAPGPRRLPRAGRPAAPPGPQSGRSPSTRSRPARPLPPPQAAQPSAGSLPGPARPADRGRGPAGWRCRAWDARSPGHGPGRGCPAGRRSPARRRRGPAGPGPQPPLPPSRLKTHCRISRSGRPRSRRPRAVTTWAVIFDQARKLPCPACTSA